MSTAIDRLAQRAAQDMADAAGVDPQIFFNIAKAVIRWLQDEQLVGEVE